MSQMNAQNTTLKLMVVDTTITAKEQHLLGL